MSTDPATEPEPDPLDRLGPALRDLHRRHAEFVASGAAGPFRPGPATPLLLAGDGAVVLNLRAAGDVADAAAELADLGMTDLRIDAATGTLEGALPIGRLAALAASDRIAVIRAVRPPLHG